MRVQGREMPPFGHIYLKIHDLAGSDPETGRKRGRRGREKIGG